MQDHAIIFILIEFFLDGNLLRTTINLFEQKAVSHQISIRVLQEFL